MVSARIHPWGAIRVSEPSVCCLIARRVGGACRPPPPFVAPLVPRCALTSGATPLHDGRSAQGYVLGRRQTSPGPTSTQKTEIFRRGFVMPLAQPGRPEAAAAGLDDSRHFSNSLFFETLSPEDVWR